MSEKKLLNCIMIEGFLAMILGLCVLILPKLTSLSFGVMLSAAFITYGIYKIVHSIINRNYGFGLIFPFVMGVFLATVGILLLFVPKVSLLWLIALIGVYFLLDSMSITAFISRIRNLYNFWGCKMFAAGVLFLAGLVIVIGLPSISFWMVCMLSGICLLVKGMSKAALYLTNKNNYDVR